MSCRAWHDLLQRHLDGEGPLEELEQHFARCPECAGERPAVRQLLKGLTLLHPPTVPVGLSDRLTTRLMAEPLPWTRRLRRWRPVVLAGLAAAAAVVLALTWWTWRPAEPASPVPPEPLLQAAAPPAEPLRESMAEASEAVAALTSRAASETVESTSTLLPLVRQTTLDPLTPMTSPLEAPLEPSLDSIREATAGVSAGMAPVADSARRAVGLFLRDLPMSRTPNKDPG